MKNVEVSVLFQELADLLEIQGANAFRVRAYRNAARTITDLREPLASIAADDRRSLEDIPGIGKDLSAKIRTILETGELPQLEELRAQVPREVVGMLRLPGVGPRKVAQLFEELDIQSLDDLRAAAESGQIAALKGFGKKTAQTILEGLDQIEGSEERTKLANAKAAADEILADLKTAPGVVAAEVAGSCRRRKETCGDLDLLVATSDPATVMDRLAEHRLVVKQLSRGDTKQRVRLVLGIELDLRVVPEHSFGAALQYFTGSPAHNIAIRRRAQQRGLKVNEYGVFDGDEQVAGEDEESVYAAVELPWIAPELREDRGEIEQGEQDDLPKLIELSDIRGDLHMHTTASDGKATIEEMIAGAKQRKLKYIAITDHSKRVSMANGLDAARLRAHWKNIERISSKVSGIEVLRGIECDILEDATMDLPDDVLAEADWVIAVLHYGLRQPRKQIMKRLLAAVRHPHVDIIGHPSGRMIGRRGGADIDFPELFKAAADHGVMMEINANPNRLDLDDIQAAAAKDHGIPIVINTDSHSTGEFDKMIYGVYQARRAGLEKKDVANTKTAAQFRRLLR